MSSGVAEVLKDRDLLARVAVHSPHIAGTMLRLLNDFEDAARLGELPPAPLLAALGGYVEGLGKLIAALAAPANAQSTDTCAICRCVGLFVADLLRAQNDRRVLGGLGAALR